MISIEYYERKKSALINEVKEIKGSISLGKTTSNLFRYRNTQAKKIDVRHFNNVISVDKKNKIAEVEGMTPYETLVDETLKFGLMPAVVPELKTITIGGAVTGIGIESSSFKYGFVHETVEEIEVLLGNGKTITCNKKDNSDLFYSFPNSYGTLGYALKLKIKLIPVKKYVKLIHFHYDDEELFFNELKRFCDENKADFVDGTIFSNQDMYITLGSFTDTCEKASDYTNMCIYYKSIKKKKVDFLTTRDYIWRWDTDWFWCSEHFYVQNKIVRAFVNKKNLNSKTYFNIRQKASKSKFLNILRKAFKSEAVIQDVEIPIENAREFIDFFHNEIKINPIWVCPVRSYSKSNYTLYPMTKNKLYVNFGFWDVVKTDRSPGHYNKLVENKVFDLEGKKSLYSDSYYTKQRFWSLYNGKEYFKLKQKYDPQNTFKDLYEKCVLRK